MRLGRKFPPIFRTFILQLTARSLFVKANLCGCGAPFAHFTAQHAIPRYELVCNTCWFRKKKEFSTANRTNTHRVTARTCNYPSTQTGDRNWTCTRSVYNSSMRQAQYCCNPPFIFTNINLHLYMWNTEESTEQRRR